MSARAGGWLAPEPPNTSSHSQQRGCRETTVVFTCLSAPNRAGMAASPPLLLRYFAKAGSRVNGWGVEGVGVGVGMGGGSMAPIMSTSI